MVFSFTACGNTLKGENGITEKARKEIPVADIKNMDINIMGSHFFGDRQVFWLMTGNEYQYNRYFAMETEVKGEDEYEFLKLYEPVDRGEDIRVLIYRCIGENVADMYHLFMINNPECVKLVINGEEIMVDSHPFIYKYKELEGEYLFLDKDGKEIY